jgi:hypothetical protein
MRAPAVAERAEVRVTPELAAAHGLTSEEYERLRGRGRATVVEHYAWSAKARQLETVLETVAGSRSAQRVNAPR